MRRIAVAALVVLTAIGCGGNRPWKENIVTAAGEIAAVDPAAPYANISNEATAKSTVDDLCALPNDPSYEDPETKANVALAPLGFRVALERSGVGDDTIATLFQAIDDGLSAECSDNKELIFSWVPYDGWSDSLNCAIDDDFEVATATDVSIAAACG